MKQKDCLCRLTQTGTFDRAETVVVLRVLFRIDDAVPVEVSRPPVAVWPPSEADAPAEVNATAADLVHKWCAGWHIVAMKAGKRRTADG